MKKKTQKKVVIEGAIDSRFSRDGGGNLWSLIHLNSLEYDKDGDYIGDYYGSIPVWGDNDADTITDADVMLAMENWAINKSNFEEMPKLVIKN